MDCDQTSFKLLWRCHQLLSEFINKGYLPRVSPQLRLSTNDKDDKKVIPEAVDRSPGIELTGEENPREPQLGDCQ
jgi:hypothetical protein